MQSVEFTRAYSALKRGKGIPMLISTVFCFVAISQINKA